MQINYSDIIKKNLEKVLHDVLTIVSKEGFKEGHHLYITIDLNNKDIEIPSWLKNKYKNEITIVLQNEYWNLKVKKNKFTVNLSFNNIPTKISVPFDAVLSFADPYANIGLQVSGFKNKKNNGSEKKIKTDINKKSKIIKLDKYRKS